MQTTEFVRLELDGFKPSSSGSGGDENAVSIPPAESAQINSGLQSEMPTSD